MFLEAFMVFGVFFNVCYKCFVFFTFLKMFGLVQQISLFKMFGVDKFLRFLVFCCVFVCFFMFLYPKTSKTYKN